MDLGLTGRVIVITGGTSGIGKATALAFAAAGARVVLTYRTNREKAESVAAQIHQCGSEAEIGFFDLSDGSSIDAVVDRAVERWGRLDVLVNNALEWIPLAHAWQGPFDTCPPQYWLPLMRANSEGPLLATQRVIPVMRQQRWGRIVNVSSVAAEDGMPRLGWYSAAKSTLHGLTRTLAKELGPDGILVNVVMAGATATEKIADSVLAPRLERKTARLPIRRLPTPEEVAAPIVFLASAANACITGEVVRVSGGRT